MAFRLRLRLLQAATVALYAGPLLAGLAGYGWAMLPPFVSVFMLWLVILRPHQWPQKQSDLLRQETWVAMTAQLMTQLLLVAVLFGIGRGIGGVTGQLAMLHPILPVAVSFFALPLSRLAWNGEAALAQGVTLDEVLYPAPRPAPAVAAAPTPDAAVQPLLALADGAPLPQAGPLLDDVLDHGDAWARLAVLTTRLEEAPARHGALRVALIHWATDPGLLASNSAPAALRSAFRVAGADLGLLRLLLPRAAALARALPERHGAFPDPADLHALARLSLPQQLQSDLGSLMQTLGCAVDEQVRPPRRQPQGGAMASAAAT